MLGAFGSSARGGDRVSSVAPLVIRRSGRLVRLSAYAELAKLRIATLELVVVAVAMVLAAEGNWSPWLFAATLFGTACVAASASGANQWLERSHDSQMVRTSNRPLPAGRLTPREVLVFCVVTLLMGSVTLWTAVRPLCAVVGVATWVLYVAVYTPLKSRTPLNTTIGAVAGALPVLIGWTAVSAQVDLTVLALLMILFLWQFPHFMAIAWLYRDDYAAAGSQMLPVVDPSGLRAGSLAVAAALALVPVSLVPALTPLSANVTIYAAWAVALSFAQAAAAGLFLLRRDDMSARWLLRASLIYLPCMMGLLLLVVV